MEGDALAQERVVKALISYIWPALSQGKQKMSKTEMQTIYWRVEAIISHIQIAPQ